MLLDFAFFFAALALLILAHEFGHFLVARKNGVRVDEFGFGFPPRLFGFQKGDTFYSFNLLPLGGFVKIAGENETTSKESDNFASKKAVIRAKILFAGIFFNILLGWVIFSLALNWGIPIDAEDPRWNSRVTEKSVGVVEVLGLSAADQAGIKPGDKILSLESEDRALIAPETVLEVQNFTQASAGHRVKIEVERKDEKILFEPVLGAINIPPLGAALALVGKLQAPWYLAPLWGAELTIVSLGRILQGFYFLLTLLFSGSSIAGMVSGPVGIFSIVSGTLKLGVPVLMSLLALLSLNLAIINLIPIPGLDGGRLLFLAIEVIRGKPIDQKVSSLAHSAGFAILILLMAVITYLDISGLPR